MNPNERFEIVAAVFHKETGYLAPGKDQACASESLEAERAEAWTDFHAAYGRIVGYAIDVTERALISEYDPQRAAARECDEAYAARMKREQSDHESETISWANRGG